MSLPSWQLDFHMSKVFLRISYWVQNALHVIPCAGRISKPAREADIINQYIMMHDA